VMVLGPVITDKQHHLTLSSAICGDRTNPCRA
jgi:hypothetical protein